MDTAGPDKHQDTAHAPSAPAVGRTPRDGTQVATSPRDSTPPPPTPQAGSQSPPCTTRGRPEVLENQRNRGLIPEGEPLLQWFFRSLAPANSEAVLAVGVRSVCAFAAKRSELGAVRRWGRGHVPVDEGDKTASVGRSSARPQQ